MAGSSSVDELKFFLNSNGFKDIEIIEKELSQEYIEKWKREDDSIKGFVKSSITKAKK